jgi:hypothetical protein
MRGPEGDERAQENWWLRLGVSRREAGLWEEIDSEQTTWEEKDELGILRSAHMLWRALRDCPREIKRLSAEGLDYLHDLIKF